MQKREARRKNGEAAVVPNVYLIPTSKSQSVLAASSVFNAFVVTESGSEIDPSTGDDDDDDDEEYSGMSGSKRRKSSRTKSRSTRLTRSSERRKQGNSV